jgi:hypothetical protein
LVGSRSARRPFLKRIIEIAQPEVRPHQGRWCYGKTPLRTFVDSLPLAREKILAPAALAQGGAEG